LSLWEGPVTLDHGFKFFGDRGVDLRRAIRRSRNKSQKMLEGTEKTCSTEERVWGSGDAAANRTYQSLGEEDGKPWVSRLRRDVGRKSKGRRCLRRGEKGS